MQVAAWQSMKSANTCERMLDLIGHTLPLLSGFQATAIYATKLLLARVVYLGIILMPQIDYIGTCC